MINHQSEGKKWAKPYFMLYLLYIYCSFLAILLNWVTYYNK